MFDVQVNTAMSFMLRPQADMRQEITQDEFVLKPRVSVEQATDIFGNTVQRLVAPPGEFELSASVDALVGPTERVAEDAGFVSIHNLPAEILTYLLPSRYCESDRFGDMATQIVAGQALGSAQVQAITTWVRDKIRNVPLSSTFPVSAAEVNRRGEGVCRDLAHMGITLCRALCIPARLVVGYLDGLEPMDIHAWFEAYVGGRWWTFDPSVATAIDYRIVIARGRDAADVAIYNQYGPMLLPRYMRVSVSRV